MQHELKTRHLLIALATVGLSAMAVKAGAADLADGTTVRIRSSWIEAGWHTGRIKRDGRSCLTIELDHPTDGGHTQVDLTVVDALQLGRTGSWTAINAKRALAAVPPYCFTAESN